MVVIIVDKKPRKVLLTLDEIDTIKNALEYQSHRVFTFLDCDKIIKKLNDVLEEKIK